MNKWLLVVAFLLHIAAAAFITMIGMVIFAFMGIDERPVFATGAIFFICLIALWFKRVRKWAIAVAVVPVLALTAYAFYVDYQREQREQYAQVVGEVDLQYYAPFQNNELVAQLDKPASLHLTQPLPKIDGATALYPLYAAFVQATYPQGNYYETVLSNKTPEAYINLINGKVDVIFVAQPSDEQLAMAKNKGVEMQLTPIGREAFVFFVHHDNPVNQLSTEQIQAIYSGSLKNWQEVGGRDEPIRAYQRPKNSGSQTMLEKIMQGKPLMEAPIEDRAEGMGGIIREVAAYRNYPNGLGYSFLFFATKMAGNKQIKLLAINGIEPTRENITNSRYPFAKPFYAVTIKGKSTPETQRLIDWILSPEGQELVKKTGYTPL